MLAIDERNEWRRQMQAGEVPDIVRFHIDLYRSMRNRPDWRATRAYETLGEAACIWLDAKDAMTAWTDGMLEEQRTKWIHEALDLDKAGNAPSAAYLIMSNFDDMFHAGFFKEVDVILDLMQHVNVSVNVGISLLTSSLPAKDKLINRSDFFNRFKESVASREDREALLMGLE